MKKAGLVGILSGLSKVDRVLQHLRIRHLGRQNVLHRDEQAREEFEGLGTGA